MSGETLQERAKGKDVRTSNIVAAKAVANAIRTSLGPRGMDKMIQLPGGGNNSYGEVLISNDGATILSQMKVLHPAAKMLVDMSQSQDIEAGDGTTTVVVLAGALLEACGTLLQKGIHPSIICSSFIKACDKACDILKKISKPVQLNDRESLLNAVTTCLSSKVVAQNSDILAPIAVDSVLGILTQKQIEDAVANPDKVINVDLRDIRIVQQMGGTVDDTELVDGLVLTRGKSSIAKAAGGPTSMKNAKIGLIQFCLSAPKTDMDNNVVIQDYTAMDRLLREERKYILNQCKAIKKAGINVLLIQKSILRDAYNELSLHFLAKMNILVVTDVERNDIEFICKTLGCIPVAHIDQLSPDKLGHAENVTDVFIEGSSSKVVKFTGIQNNGTSANSGGASGTAKKTQTMTVLLRGSNELVLGEANRSLHDAQCVVRSLIKQRYIIAGGGAAEIEASIELMKYAHTGLTTMAFGEEKVEEEEMDCQGTIINKGMESYCIQAYADALEVVPYTLAENAGMKPIEIVTELRKQHASAAFDNDTEASSHNIPVGKGTGINVAGANKRAAGVVSDMYKLNVVQPLLVSTSALQLATETVCMIMKIDDLIVVA